MLKRVKQLAIRASAVIGGLAVSGSAWAATTGGSALPWESPLTTVKDSLTGPVAGAIAVIALGSAGAAMVFGGEMSDFTRRLCMIVMAISFLVGGASFMSAVFPTATGALIF
jgi:type IV secretion system protein TrbC